MYNVVGMWNKHNFKGFTLVELVITVGLVAILSAGVMSLIGQGSSKYARDARRQTDLQTIVSALVMYRNDRGEYPESTNDLTGPTVYLSPVPVDPANSTVYRYTPTIGAAGRRVGFTLCARSEKDSTTNMNGVCGGNCGGQNCVFVARNP